MPTSWPDQIPGVADALQGLPDASPVIARRPFHGTDCLRLPPTAALSQQPSLCRAEVRCNSNCSRRLLGCHSCRRVIDCSRRALIGATEQPVSRTADAANGNLAALDIQVLDAQSERLEQSQSAAVEQHRDQLFVASQMRHHSRHLVDGQIRQVAVSGDAHERRLRRGRAVDQARAHREREWLTKLGFVSTRRHVPEPQGSSGSD